MAMEKKRAPLSSNAPRELNRVNRRDILKYLRYSALTVCERELEFHRHPGETNENCSDDRLPGCEANRRSDRSKSTRASEGCSRCRLRRTRRTDRSCANGSSSSFLNSRRRNQGTDCGS